MSKKTEIYKDEPIKAGKRVADILPKGKDLRKSRVRVFKEDGSIEESVFDQIQVSFASPKQSLTVRFDQEVIEYFKALGSGYQSKMNAVLKAFVDHERHKLHH